MQGRPPVLVSCEPPTRCTRGEQAAHCPVVLALVATDFQQEIKDLRATMTSVREVTDLTALEATIADLEEQVRRRRAEDDPS